MILKYMNHVLKGKYSNMKKLIIILVFVSINYILIVCSCHRSIKINDKKCNDLLYLYAEGIEPNLKSIRTNNKFYNYINISPWE
jgi:hypothetical protein